MEYLIRVTIFAGLYAIFALGLNLQWGFTGLINFGHVAFMTLGAYATVLLSAQGIPVIVAIAVGAGLAAVLGLVVGASTLRLREDYLAIVTIGLSEVVRLVANNEEWLTRGTFGVQSYPIPLRDWEPNLPGKLLAIAVLTLLALYGAWQLWQSFQRQKQAKSRKSLVGPIIWAAIGGILLAIVYGNGAIALWQYDAKAGLMLLVLLALALVYSLLEFLGKSPWGRVLKAIREDEQVPRALGKNIFAYKVQSLMLGGAIASLAGAFFAWQLTTVYPTSFDPLVTFNAWTIVVLGGAGSNPGTILGAIIFWAYDSLTRFALEELPWFDSTQAGAFRVMAIGLILMGLMLWRPQGILGKKEELTLGR